MKTQRTFKPRGAPIPKKRKFSNKELAAIYDVKPRYWRYNGLKGILWFVTSVYVRRRDFKLWGRKCVSCPATFITWEEGQAGHFVSASKGGLGLLFDTTNIALQCAKCNNPSWTPDASIPFAIELDRRYGAGTASALWERRKLFTDSLTEREYDQAIRHLQGELALL